VGFAQKEALSSRIFMAKEHWDYREKIEMMMNRSDGV
jgi:hypothetical protein